MTATLIPMTEEEYAAFVVRSIDDFASDVARAASLPIEVARSQAAAQLAGLLPEGRATPGHHFEVVADDGRPVGQLWVGPHPQRSDSAFVYDILIDTAERGRGFGRAAMLAAEQLARQDQDARLGHKVGKIAAPL